LAGPLQWIVWQQISLANFLIAFASLKGYALVCIQHNNTAQDVPAIFKLAF